MKKKGTRLCPKRGELDAKALACPNMITPTKAIFISSLLGLLLTDLAYGRNQLYMQSAVVYVKVGQSKVGSLEVQQIANQPANAIYGKVHITMLDASLHPIPMDSSIFELLTLTVTVQYFGRTPIYIRATPRADSNYRCGISIEVDSGQMEVGAIFGVDGLDPSPNSYMSPAYSIECKVNSIPVMSLRNLFYSDLPIHFKLIPPHAPFTLKSQQTEGDLSANGVFLDTVLFSPQDTGIFFDSIVVENNATKTPNRMVFLLRGINPGKTVSQNAAKSMSIRLYPNPAKAVVYFDGLKTKSSISIFDQVGRLRITSSSHSGIDVSSLQPGAYIARVNDPQSAAWLRFVKAEDR
jgi:hypothetical protein